MARIASITEFNVDENTLKLMNSLKDELNTLSKERVFTELKKALEANKPSIFFDILRKAKVLDVHFKEINDLIGALQPQEYHPEGDSYNHTMIVLDKTATLTKSLEIRFAGLVHDIGKGVTPKEMYPHHYGHDKKGVEVVRSFAQKLGIPNLWLACAKTACSEHMKGGIFYKMTPAKKVQFIERVAKSKLGLDGLQIVVIADKCSTRDTKKEDINFATIGKKCITTINGEYIKEKYNIAEGIEFAQKLHEERVKWMKDFYNNTNKDCN